MERATEKVHLFPTRNRALEVYYGLGSCPEVTGDDIDAVYLLNSAGRRVQDDFGELALRLQNNGIEPIYHESGRHNRDNNPFSYQSLRLVSRLNTEAVGKRVAILGRSAGGRVSLGALANPSLKVRDNIAAAMTVSTPLGRPDMASRRLRWVVGIQNRAPEPMLRAPLKATRRIIQHIPKDVDPSDRLTMLEEQVKELGWIYDSTLNEDWWSITEKIPPDTNLLVVTNELDRFVVGAGDPQKRMQSNVNRLVIPGRRGHDNISPEATMRLLGHLARNRPRT